MINDAQEILHILTNLITPRALFFPHIHVEFGQTVNSAIRSADPVNPILEANTE